MEIGNIENTPLTSTGRLEPYRELIQAVRVVNATGLFGRDNDLSFALDAETRGPVLRIVDRGTRAVIRQLPPGEVLRLAERLRKLVGGKEIGKTHAV